MCFRTTRRKLMIIAGYTSFFLCLAYYLVASHGTAYAGLIGEFVDDKWTITEVDPMGIGANLGISVHDVILAVDDLPLTKNAALETWHRFNIRNSIVVKTPDGSIRSIQTSVDWLDSSTSAFASMSIIGLLFLLFGHFILCRENKWGKGLRIYIFCWLISIILISIIAAGRNLPLSREFELLGIVLVLPLLAYLLRNPRAQKRLEISEFFTALPGVFILLSHFAWVTFLWQWVDLYKFNRVIILLYIFGWCIICLLSLLTRLLTTKLGKTALRKTLWITFLSLTPFLALTIFPMMLWGIPIVSVEHIAIFVTLMLVIGWVLHTRYHNNKLN